MIFFRDDLAGTIVVHGPERATDAFEGNGHRLDRLRIKGRILQ
jgi:hypothetical protein